MKGTGDQDHYHIQQILNTLDKKTLDYYHYIYLKKDVLLLADIFENFQNTCQKHYKLHLAQFYTAPELE